MSWKKDPSTGQWYQGADQDAPDTHVYTNTSSSGGFGAPTPAIAKAPLAPAKPDYTKLLTGMLGGGGAPSGAPAKGAFTQKNGKWYDSAGQELVQGPSGFKLAGGGASGGGGQAGGGGTLAGPSTGSGGVPDFTNTAQKDPYLAHLADKVTSRIDNAPDNTARQIDTVGLKLPALAEGQKQEMGARSAQRGTYGSGADQAAEQQIDTRTSGEIAGAARDITDTNQQRNDAFLLGSTGALGAVGGAAREDRAQAANLWIANEANRRAQEAQQLQQQLAVLNLIGNLAG